MQPPLSLLAATGVCIVIIYAWNNGAGYLMVLLVPLSWVAVDCGYQYASNIKKGLLVFQSHCLRLMRKDEYSEDILRQAAAMPWALPTATIEKNLKKKLGQVLAEGGTLVIMGGDGYPVAAPGYGWGRHLREFLSRGCVITQYVVDPTDEADQTFRSLAEEFTGDAGDGYGRFLYKRLSVPESNDQDGRRLVEGLMTFHPTLASNDQGDRMLWIEGYHPPRSTRAVACEYYSPKDLAIVADSYLECESMLKAADRYVQ